MFCHFKCNILFSILILKTIDRNFAQPTQLQKCSQTREDVDVCIFLFLIQKECTNAPS